jgi:hypothetical protein
VVRRLTGSKQGRFGDPELLAKGRKIVTTNEAGRMNV